MDRMTKLLSAMLLSCAALLSACGGGGSDNNRPSSNANLTSLLVESAALNPAFASSTTSYTADVTGGTTETRVTAITTDRGARLTINGAAVVSGSASDPIGLIVGVTNVDIVVTAEDGTQRTYSVAIVRPAPNTEARLAELALSAGELLQPFDPDQFSYDADYGFLATTTRAVADPLDPLASGLSVEGEETVFGAPSNPIPLAVGVDATTLEVTVTAEDAVTTRTYEVEISRAEFSTVDQRTYAKASNTDANDRFGASMALSGNLLVVSAPEEQSLATGVDGNQGDNTGNAVGAAYLYERSGGAWAFGHYLKADNADNGDRFGVSVASTPDLLAIGAPEEQSRTGDPGDNSGNAVGAVYLFDPDLAGAPDQIAYLKAGNRDEGDQFGFTIVAEQNRVLVGAPFEASNATGVNGDASDNSLNNAGAAYLFEEDDAGNFVQTAYIKASNSSSGTNNQFGNALALSGDTLAVAAWLEDGGSPGINGDQSDTSTPNAGAVYVFEKDGTDVWAQTAYVKANNLGPNHNFGTAVALDGDTLAVGAPFEPTGALGAGAVYVFTRDAAGTWSQDTMLKADVVGFEDRFGNVSFIFLWHRGYN